MPSDINPVGRGGNPERHALACQELAHVGEPDVHDPLNIGHAERVKHHDVVDAVQESGPEREGPWHRRDCGASARRISRIYDSGCSRFYAGNRDRHKTVAANHPDRTSTASPNIDDDYARRCDTRLSKRQTRVGGPREHRGIDCRRHMFVLIGAPGQLTRVPLNKN